MAKGNNNVRNKKPHSSKPYDVSNSFVKKVTSGVTSLLPQTSWLSRWFASSSTVVEDRPPITNDDDDNEDEHVSHSPPTKRARIPLNRPFPANSFRVSSPIDRGETHPWPSESIASPIPNVFSDTAVPGPSGLSRTPVSSPFQSPPTNTEGLEGKINGDGGSDSSESTSGCSSLAPQRATSSGTNVAHRASVDSKIPNHMSSYSLFPTSTHKLSPSVNPSLGRRRPSFNVSSFGSPNFDSSKLSRESSLSSPFYIGRTMYGGASAYRRPREGASSESFLSSTRRGGVTVRPSNEKSQSGASAETSMSQTARRILEALEQFSSPVSEARRMPLPPQPALGAKRKRPLESMSNSPIKSPAPAAATNPLTIPMPPERLRLHRLQDATEAARRIASSSSSNKYTLRGSDDGPHSGRGKVTRSKPLDEDELPLPVNLPHASLEITTLPSFDLFETPAQSGSANMRTNNSKPIPQFAENRDKLEGEKSKISSMVSTGSSANTTRYVDSAAATAATATASSGMKSVNFMHVKSSSEISKYKLDTVNTDASDAKSGRKREIASDTAIIFNKSPKSNPKSVSFSGTVSYHVVNSPVNSRDKLEKSNSSLSSEMSSASAVTTFMVKGAPFSNARADSGNSLTTNDYAFSNPTVLPTPKLKETEAKTKNYDFCKPAVLDSSKYGSKLMRNEPNGFHKLHSSSKVDHDSPAAPNVSCKEGSGKVYVNKDCESDVQSPVTPNAVASREKENNGWAAKFSVPDTWECSSCMVRNKNDIKVCVCCGSKVPSTSPSVSVDTEKKGSAVPNTVSPISSSGWGSSYTLQPGMWECSACFVRNKPSDVKCVACTTPKSGSNKSTAPVSTQQSNWGSQFRLKAGIWECSVCCVRNKEQDVKCVSCTTPRSTKSVSQGDSTTDNSKTVDNWGQKFKKPSGSWECPVCMIPNKDSLLKCAACQEPKPGMDKNRTSSGGSIKFNFEMPSGSSGFKFGIDKAELKQPEVSSSTFSIGGSAKTDTANAPVQTGFVFGANTTEAKIPAGIKFGISSQDSNSPIVTGKSNTKEGEIISTSAPSVPSLASGTCSPASQKLPQQSESPKAAGFTFRVPTGSSITSGNESVGEAKKSASTSDTPDASKKDFKFGVSQASPTISNADAEKTSGTFTAVVSKTEQKIVAEVKPSFNLGTSSTSTAVASAITTSAVTAVTKPAAFSFSSNITTTSAPSIATTSTTSVAVTTSVSSSSTPIFSFGSNQTSINKNLGTSTPTFSFGATGGQATSSGFFSAGSSGQFKPADGLFSNKLTTSSNVPVFGGSSATSPKMSALPSFGSTASASTTSTAAASVTAVTTVSSITPISASTNIVTFGTSAPPVFASPNTSTSFGSGITKPTFASTTSSFGSVTTSAAVAGPPSVTTSGVSASPASSFGVQTTSASATPGFGVPVTSSFTSSVPTFGTSTTSSFGVSATTTPAAITTAASTFGTNSGVSFGGATTTGNCFGSTSATPSFSSSTPNVFGTTNTPSFGSPSIPPTFGAAPGTSNFGNNFGGVTTAPSFGTATSAVTTVSSSSSLPAFGGFSNPAKSAQGIFMFGSNPTVTTQSSSFFNTASQAGGTHPAPSGTTAFSFGSGAVSSATNVTTSTSTTPTAAAVAPAPTQGFGGFSFAGGAPTATPGATSVFGNTSATPVFGAPSISSPASSAPSFGTGSSTNAGVFRPPTFNFGSGGSQQSFAFGSGAQAGATPAGNSGFSFGQGQPSQPQPLQFNPNMRPTFNFTGGETPQFTASAPPAPQRRVKKAVRRAIR